MIAKLESISYIKNALLYCERGGELLYSNKCIGNGEAIFAQIKNNNKLNDRCIKNGFHIKIRIAPEDQGKLSNQDWIDISNKYASKIGIQNNLFATYIHEEGTDKEHIHIVSTRIKSNNKAVTDEYTHLRNLDFCRYIEKKYSLRRVKRVLESYKSQTKFISEDKRILALKIKIEKAINQSDNMNDFVFHLKNLDIKTKIGRGISFINKDGTDIKGSKIDRKYSLKGIEKLLSYKQQENRFNSKHKGKGI